jgi:hypothetical protein
MEFTNTAVRELFAACGVQDIKTLAYSKEENSLGERANKEVMRHLRNILFHSNITTHWNAHLETVMKIMNHQKRGSFFPSPTSILFGDRFRDDELLFMAQSQAHMDGAMPQLSAWANSTPYLNRRKEYKIIRTKSTHNNMLNNRRDLKFKAHWKGYEADEGSWVPYSELRDTEALHKYLLAQPGREFQRLIPSKFFKNGQYSPDEE